VKLHVPSAAGAIGCAAGFESSTEDPLPVPEQQPGAGGAWRPDVAHMAQGIGPKRVAGPSCLPAGRLACRADLLEPLREEYHEDRDVARV
jgi:hypothetical protein